MKIKKGFTLIEVLVSMVLLTFVILISSTLFDHAIQNTPAIQQAISTNNKINSDMEDGVLLAKEYLSFILVGETPEDQKPEGFDKNPNFIKIDAGFNIGSENFKNVKGYIVSESVKRKDIKKNGTFDAVYDLKFNDAKKTDDAYTFVGYGHSAAQVADIDYLYIEGSDRFEFLPIFDESGQIHAFPEKLITGKYRIENNKNIDRFLAMRLRAVKSIVQNPEDGSIYRPYVEVSGDKNVGYSGFTLMLEEAKDKEEKNGSEKLYEIHNYRYDKKLYLDTIDRNFAVTGMTLNKDGSIGSTIYSLGNKQTGGLRTKYYIGLPCTYRLSALYDMNLAIAKSKEDPLSYVSLLAKPELTDYPDFLGQPDSEGRRKVDWGVNDVRKLLNLENVNSGAKHYPTNSNDIKINGGFIQGEYSYPYGNTMYLNTINNPVVFGMGEDTAQHTFITKFNPYNYEKRFNKKLGKYALLSYNMDENGKMTTEAEEHLMDPKTKKVRDSIYSNGDSVGFCVFVDEEGNVKRDVAILNITENTKPGGVTERLGNITYQRNEDMHYNIKDTNLYNNIDGKNKIIDELDNFKDREGFNVLACSFSQVVNPDEVYVYISLLERDKDSDTIKTNVHPLIPERTPLNPNVMSIKCKYDKSQADNRNLKFGIRYKNDDDETFPDETEAGAIEMSDVIFTNIDLHVGGASKMIKRNMEYLYRKYMTERERNDYDKYILKSW